MVDLESKRKKYDKLIKVLVFAGIGCVFAPFAVLAIGGLVGLVVTWVISEAVICFTPWMSMKFANWRVAAIKHEAARNPIETLENDYRTALERLSEKREHIRTFHASVKTFHGKLSGFKEQFPGDAKQFDDQYSAMVQLLELRKQKYIQAKENLQKFEGVIARARAIWSMAQESAKLRNAAAIGDEEFYAKLRTETALDSVTTSMNSAFADLEDALLDEKDGKPVVQVMSGAAQPVIPEKAGPPTLDLEFEDQPEPEVVKPQRKNQKQ